MNKQQVLYNAMAVLNQPNQPWQVQVEQDSLIATWKWMDATFFGVGTVTDEEKEYKFIVTLLDNGKWTEKDISKESQAKVNFNNGKLSFGSSSFSGTSTRKSITIGLGKNNQTGQTGVIAFRFDTNIIKEPIRAYLKANGYKKKGLFW